jgi:hypothetical protein
VLDDMIRSVEPLPPLKMLVGTNLVFRSSLGECRKNPLTIKGSKTLSIP